MTDKSDSSVPQTENETIDPRVIDAGSSSVNTSAETVAQGRKPGYGVDLAKILNLQPSTREGSMGRMAHYDVLNVVGCGGMGVVARAFDEQLHRSVAIKVMSDRLIASDRARQRFLREARAAASINHPNVVTIHAVSDEGTVPFLVMEYVEGKSLQDHINENAPLSSEDVLRIGAQIAAGLAAAHRHGIVHRDIKPGNVMLEDGIQRVKLTDFGLARLVVEHSDLTSLGDMVGTPSYMSPEQVESGDVTPASDLFSLGCVLYAMVKGKSPFHASTTYTAAQRVREMEPPLLSSLSSDVPSELDALVTQLLCKDPADRPRSARDVAETLLEWTASNQQSSVIRRAPNLQSQRTARRRTVGWLGASALAVCGLVGSYLFFPPSGSPTKDTGLNAVHNALADGVLRVDPNDGEFATLSEAMGHAIPNITIELGPGTYRGPFDIAGSDQFQGVKIVGSKDVVLLAPGATPVIRIANTIDVQIIGITVQTGMHQSGLKVMGDCQGSKIRNVSFRTIGGKQSISLVHVETGGSSVGANPLTIEGCDLDARSVGLVLGNTEVAPVSNVLIRDNSINGESREYGIPLVIQGRMDTVVIQQNVFRDGLGGISILIPEPDWASDVLIQGNAICNVENAFLMNDSSTEQGLKIQKNLVVQSRTLNSPTEDVTNYSRWFDENHWVSDGNEDTQLVEQMFVPQAADVLKSNDPASDDYLRASENAPPELPRIFSSVE